MFLSRNYQLIVASLKVDVVQKKRSNQTMHLAICTQSNVVAELLNRRIYICNNVSFNFFSEECL